MNDKKRIYAWKMTILNICPFVSQKYFKKMKERQKFAARNRSLACWNPTETKQRTSVA